MAAIDKLSKAILSNVLYFLISARSTLANDRIILIAIAFFKDEAIIRSKETFFESAGSTP